MADTVYLNDGSTEVVFTDKREFLEKLIREKLGDDAARYFNSFVEDWEAEAEANKDRVREHDLAADGYLELCRDAVEHFDMILTMLDAPRLDRAKLKMTARDGWNNLQQNL